MVTAGNRNYFLFPWTVEWPDYYVLFMICYDDFICFSFKCFIRWYISYVVSCCTHMLCVCVCVCLNVEILYPLVVLTLYPITLPVSVNHSSWEYFMLLFFKYLLLMVNTACFCCQVDVMEFLKKSKYWQRSGGRDHVFPMTHPNAFRFLRDQVNESIQVVVDFGRYPKRMSNLNKDVVSPYVHVVDSFTDDELQDPYESRSTLLFFRGRTFRKDVCLAESWLKE